MQAFSPDDLNLHQKVTDLHCVPGLALAAATVRSVDRDSDQYLSCVWSFPLDGGEPLQLTRGPGLDRSPRWSPDGRQLALLSSRAGGAPQLYVMRRDGGEARQLAQFELGATQLHWAPDSRVLYACVALPVDPGLRGRRDKSPDNAKPRGPAEPEVCWRLPYKSDGVGFLLQREIHLFSVDVSTGEASRLTDGAFDVQAFAPSPNGRHIAYSRSREGRYAHCTDLWVCDTDGSHHRRISRDLATVMQPVWSPNGRWIAFAGAKAEGDGQSGLWLLEFGSGRITPLGPEALEVADSEAMHWTSDSLHLVLSRAHEGRHEVVSISVPAGQLETLVGGNRQLGALACDGAHLVYAVEAPDQPSEVFACSLDGQGERPISALNPWWRDRTPLELQSREFLVPDGRGGMETIKGWLLLARGAKGPLPLLNDVHGGPASYALLDYDTNVYWQSLCSRGWAVLMLNAVGSSSFGREFCERLAGHWGEYDLPQHLAALRQLQKEGICDDRVTIAGKSYGGYLTSWSIGHCDMFRAAVVMAPVGNIETHYGTSDGGYYADPLYLNTAPHFDRRRARTLSPLHYVENSATPTLFMQGKDDERCPKCQSEELFVSMYRAGQAEAELVLYPGEDHHFLGEGRPSVRTDAADRIIEWVTRHVAQPVQKSPRDESTFESSRQQRVETD
jgi:dipeptidyl aminopeptidase/acylaminoacyl peptidase